MQNFIVIALAVLCTGVALGDKSNGMQKIIEDCNQENGVNAQEMHDFVSGKLSGAAVKDNLKCSILCVMTKKGYMNEAGKFDVDAVRSQLKEEDSKIIEPALEQCKNVSGSTPCETAFMISQCLLENNVPMH